MNQEGNNTPHQIPSNRSIVLQVPVLPQTPLIISNFLLQAKYPLLLMTM